jgi:hypothetical protein
MLCFVFVFCSCVRVTFVFCIVFHLVGVVCRVSFCALACLVHWHVLCAGTNVSNGTGTHPKKPKIHKATHREAEEEEEEEEEEKEGQQEEETDGACVGYTRAQRSSARGKQPWTSLTLQAWNFAKGRALGRRVCARTLGDDSRGRGQVTGRFCRGRDCFEGN